MLGSNQFGEAYFADDPAWIDNPITGTATVSAPVATLASTGTEKFSATAAVSSPHVTLAATGTETLSSTGAVTHPVATLAGTGNVANAAAQGNQTGSGAGSRRSRRQQFSQPPFEAGPPQELEWLPPLIAGRAWVESPTASFQGRGAVGMAGVGSVKRASTFQSSGATGPREVTGQVAIKAGTALTSSGRVRQSRQQELADDALLGLNAA